MRYILLSLCCLLFASGKAQELYFPPIGGDDWETLSPDSLNYCSDKIDALYDFLEMEETRSFLLLKDGKIVLEKYLNGFTQDSSWIWFSAGKSLRAVLVGIAQEEGYLDIQDKSSDYLGTGWTSMPAAQEDSIKVWHHLTMTTGLDESDFACTDPACLTYSADPGTRWYYHNAPYNLLKTITENATGISTLVYTNTRVKNKIGMQSGFWLPFGYNTFFFSRARDMARFGLLIQAGGTWDSNTVVLGDTEYLDQMLNTSQNLNPAYGYLWWLNGKDSYIPPGTPLSFNGPISPDAPSDVVSAAGGQGQFISISPSTGLMMIRQGSSASTDLAALSVHNAIWERIMNLECTTSTQDELEQVAFQIFPNPATDFVQIKDLSAVPEEIALYNITGRQVMVPVNNYRVDMSRLPTGIYLLKIRFKNTTYTKRIIKQ